MREHRQSLSGQSLNNGSDGWAFVFFLPLIGSLIGAVILRVACALFNKLFGKELLSPTDQPEFQPVAKPLVKTADSASPYAPPMAPLTQSNSTGGYVRGVPKPSFGKAFLICFLATIANAVLVFALGMITGFVSNGQAQDFAMLRFAILGFVVLGSFFMLTIANKLGLPTTFPRALGISGLFLLISLVTGVLIGVIIGVINYAGLL